MEPGLLDVQDQAKTCARHDVSLLFPLEVPSL